MQKRPAHECTTIDQADYAWPIEVTEREGRFEARLPFRAVVADEATRDEAIGALVHCYAELAWKGSINPHYPYRVGSPPIQHVLEILQDALQFTVELRRDNWEENVLAGENTAAAREQKTTAGGAWVDTQFNRRNEVISGLGTAIAALARVKEL